MQLGSQKGRYRVQGGGGDGEDMLRRACWLELALYGTASMDPAGKLFLEMGRGTWLSCGGAGRGTEETRTRVSMGFLQGIGHMCALWAMAKEGIESMVEPTQASIFVSGMQFS